MATDPKPSWLQNFPLSKWTLLFPVIGMLAGLAFYLLLPKKYESLAHLQQHNLHRPHGYAESAAYFASNHFSRAFPAPFTQTRLLKELNEDLNLSEKWQISEEEVIEALKQQISVEEETDSDQYTVHFLHSDSQEAQTILQRLVDLHSTRRAREEAQRAKRQLQALQDEIDDQKSKVKNTEGREKNESARALLEELVKKHEEEKTVLQTPQKPIIILKPASLPTKPVIPNLALNLVVGLLVGLLFSIFLQKPTPRPQPQGA